MPSIPLDKQRFAYKMVAGKPALHVDGQCIYKDCAWSQFTLQVKLSQVLEQAGYNDYDGLHLVLNDGLHLVFTDKTA
ncbi:MAG: hypothetical protein ACRER5_22995 [Pseudomonas sp.]